MRKYELPEMKISKFGSVDIGCITINPGGTTDSNLPVAPTDTGNTTINVSGKGATSDVANSSANTSSAFY